MLIQLVEVFLKSLQVEKTLNFVSLGKTTLI